MAHPDCHVCDDLKFIVSERDDGQLAVERCDDCSSQLTDQQAATIARSYGIDCAFTYPCYVTGVLPNAQD